MCPQWVKISHHKVIIIKVIHHKKLLFGLLRKGDSADFASKERILSQFASCCGQKTV